MKKILIVDDNQDVQTQLKWGLSKRFDILQAFNRSDAMNLFNKNLPPVVTLDLGLPPEENNAREGLACLREMLRKAPQTRVIVVTGNNDQEVALEAEKIGAYAFYRKPVDKDVLNAVIQKALNLQGSAEDT
jgi:two-component system NtrC family response regulator